MGPLRWFRMPGGHAVDPRLLAWRAAWTRAAAASDVLAAAALGRELDALGCPEDDIEIEREMLAGLEDLAALVASMQTGALPAVETGHRIVRDEPCHFTAVAALPDEPSQPVGRLLLTRRRAVFVGGPVSRTVPWHSVSDTVQLDRDLVLTRHGEAIPCRFRCNSFSDALRAAFVARILRSTARATPDL